jgi:NADPH2:quinone reductase
MKSILVQKYGGPEVLSLEEVPEPAPKEGEVLLTVKSAGINYADIMQREGLYPGGPKPPFGSGFEAAGVIEAAGPGVSEWKVGDRVMGFCSGGYSEKAIAHSKAVFKIPASLTFNQAAAIPCQYLTAYHALLTLGQLASGQTVLIQAAAGGLGTQLVQIAKITGATTIGACGSDEKCSLLRDLGCTQPINYRSTDWEAEVRKITEGKGCDLIVESVGGEVFEKSLRLVKPRGCLIVIGVASRDPRKVDALQLLRNNLTVSGFHLNGYLTDRRAMASAVIDLYKWLESGSLRIIQQHTYPLAQAAQAHRDISDRKTSGKVVLEVGRE